MMLAEVTAQQVLEQAAARMWDTAEAEAAATVAQAEAWMAYRTAYVADKSRYRHDMRAVRMYVLLRGPFVWQRTCGPAKAGGRGAARLKESGGPVAAARHSSSSSFSWQPCGRSSRSPAGMEGAARQLCRMGRVTWRLCMEWRRALGKSRRVAWLLCKTVV